MKKKLNVCNSRNKLSVSKQLKTTNSYKKLLFLKSIILQAFINKFQFQLKKKL